MNDNPPQRSPECRKLLTLLAETLDAMPENSAPDQRAEIASVLIGETLHSAYRKGLLPARSRFSAQEACSGKLFSLPPAATLEGFREDAKAALAHIDFGV